MSIYVGSKPPSVLCYIYMKLLGIKKATTERPILRNDFCEIPESQ